MASNVINNLYVYYVNSTNLLGYKKERKIISSPISQFNNKMKHTIDLSAYDGIRKMLNINCKRKVPSKASVADN